MCMNYRVIPTWRELDNQLKDMTEKYKQSEFKRMQLYQKINQLTTELEVLKGKDERSRTAA